MLEQKEAEDLHTFQLVKVGVTSKPQKELGSAVVGPYNSLSNPPRGDTARGQQRGRNIIEDH